ncbi:hypothetical protein EV147_0366 [Cupriavidus agavae]|uniref:Uncharacterized protein n=1 Tax=Cupriavidus agavae TaxID=1001822 RepID=A0A4Q7S6P4_9BURK|nr:hypothetical protein EV147_0366 [Cupriavidus agavae]
MHGPLAGGQVVMSLVAGYGSPSRTLHPVGRMGSARQQMLDTPARWRSILT